MNYDHRFHAGNFADVFKHIVFTRILLYLKRKPAAFRVIDTHAGCGVYDLAAEAADRTREWQAGIGRLKPTALSSRARELVAPYLETVGDAVHAGTLYPGSPTLALKLTRPFDRMIFCELNPQALAKLKSCVARDRRAKAIMLDGYIGLNAYIPPLERRGLVLIDPPFEADDEFDRLARALVAAYRKWSDGIFVVWCPIKERSGIERLSAHIIQAQVSNVLRLELDIGHARNEGALAANGLIVVNPPFILEEEMACLLPELQRQLGRGGGSWRMDRLTIGH